MKPTLKYFLFTFLVFFLTATYSQNENSDPSYTSTSGLPDDTVKFHILIHNISLSFEKKDFHLTDSLFSEAILLTEQLYYKRGLDALESFIANEFIRTANYQKGLEYSMILKESAEKLKYVEFTAAIDNHIGTLYWYKKDNKNALLYYKKVLEFDQKIKNKSGIAAALNNLGMVYRGMGLYKEAGESYYNALLQVLQTNDKVSLANCYNNIGVLRQKEKEFNAALDFFLKSLEVRMEIKDSLGIAISYGNIGGVYLELNQEEKAEKYLLLSYEISKRLDDLEGIQETSNFLYQLYETTERYKEALSFYKVNVEAKSSLSNEDYKREALKKEMEIKFEHELQKKTILALAEKRKQRIYIISSLVVLFIVCVFSFLLYRRFRFTKKQNAIIESQKHLVENKNKEIVDSINYAKRLQDAILPPESHIKQYLPDSFVLYKPKDIVAGDFYWMETVTSTDELILIAAADCTGHGVPGAIVSVVCSNALNRTVKEFGITDAGSILNKVRDLVIETFEKSESEVKDGMDISLASIHKTKNSNEVTLKWAGANNPLWTIKNGKLEDIKANKQPIGRSYKPLPFTTHTVSLNKGDSIYLFTDGYADQFGGPKGKKFKYKQLEELVLANHSKPMDEQKKLLDESIELWKGKLEQIDDILVIGIKV